MAAISWKSAVSGSWTTAADWSTGMIPAGGDDVTIQSGGSYTVSIAALPVSINSLTVSDTSAILAIDNSGSGGSTVAVAGALTNDGHIEIGYAGLGVATTVSVGGLSNNGEIDLTGSATVQASLLVEPAAPGTLTGKFVLSGDALLGFETGAIDAIGNSAELSLTGAKARVALGSAPNSDSALSQLGDNTGTLNLENGAVVGTTVDFLNNGVVNIDNVSGSGGSALSIGGLLTNRGNLVIGNSLLASATLVTAAELVNAGRIDLTGTGANQATLDVAAAAPSTFTGINMLVGDALLEFASGAINNIAIGEELSLDGPNARVALAAAPDRNSALAALQGNAGILNLENGAVVVVAGGLTNTGALDVDIGSGTGGSQLTIGGSLTNSAIISPNGVKIGNAELSAATIVKAAGLSNTGVTEITGAPSVQATLDIAGAAMPTLTGELILTNDALLEYRSGAITAIGGGSELWLHGAGARVALASAPGRNSALKMLATNLGTLIIENGAAVNTTTGLSNSGLVEVDNNSGTGGSRLTIGGTLTNNATGSNGVRIGNTGLIGPTIVAAAALSNTGAIDLTGSSSVQATLEIAGAAPTNLTGTYDLTNYALLEFRNGTITEIAGGAALFLDGVNARVADASALGRNSALMALAGNLGTLSLNGGAAVNTTTSLVNGGTIEVDDNGGSGGSGLAIGGTLTNSGHLTIGNSSLSVGTTVTAAALSNSGTIDLTGAPSVQAKLDIAAAAPGTLSGNFALANDALLEYKSGGITVIGSGATLSLDGALSRVAIASATGGNSALKRLASNGGTLAVDGGARLTIDGAFSNSDFLYVDTSGAGGSSLKIGGTLSNSGTFDIGNGNLSDTTTVTAAALDNLSGGKIDIVGKGSPATLTLTGAASDAGYIEIDSGGMLALHKSLSVASLATLTVNGGEISGGTLDGSGTIESSSFSSSLLDGLTIAAGTTFTGGANSFLTIDHVTVDGALQGSGSAWLVFGVSGSDTMTRISGFPTITLAGAGANKLSLTAANFTGVGGDTITVHDGNGGTTVSAASLKAADAIVVYAGTGADKLAGGAGNDVFYAGGDTTMTGKGGTNEFVFYGPGAGNVITDFAASSKNEIVFSNFGFSLGRSNASATPHALPTDLFVSNSTGRFTNTTERFAYDAENGKLFYSSDGSGGASQLVATLANHPGLDAAHLFFVT
jgi:hypothetical protein